MRLDFDDLSGDECQQQMFTNGRLELLTKYREDMRDGQEQPLFGKSVRFELAECPESHCRRVKIIVVDVAH